MEEKDFAAENHAAQPEAQDSSVAPKRRPRISESRFRDSGNYENARPAYMRNERSDYQRPTEGYQRPHSYQQGGENVEGGYQNYQRPMRPNSYRRYDSDGGYQRPSNGY